MTSFEKKLLNRLLDSYERSRLFRGENKKQIHISCIFNKKTVPEYFDESSPAYEEIHIVVRKLEEKGFLKVVWRNGRVGHIIEKVILCEEALPEIYFYLKRIPKAEQEGKALSLLQKLKEEIQTPVAHAFVIKMLNRIEKGKSVKEFFALNQLEEVVELVNTIKWIETNEEECFIREFSIFHYHDSKRFELLMTKACRILREEIPDFAVMENDEILAEYQIYHTPGYVYFKGDVNVSTGGQNIQIKDFPNGLGIAINHDSLPSFRITVGNEQIKSIYTIENLTTFFRFQKKNSLIIYLGGYHNSVRQKLLQLIYKNFPKAEYWHFGDIDAGGFQIFYNLKNKTGIPFRMYQMDLTTLKKYVIYGKMLTENDKNRLKHLLESELDSSCRETINYMLENGIKLEQECVL